MYQEYGCQHCKTRAKRKAAEEEKRKQEEAKRKAAEEEKRKQEEAKRKAAEEEKRKQIQAAEEEKPVVADEAQEPPSWSVENVAAFLDSLKLTGAAAIAQENQVDGKTLLELSDDDQTPRRPRAEQPPDEALEKRNSSADTGSRQHECAAADRRCCVALG